MVLEEGCPEHQEVCYETLVLCLCKTLAKDLQGKFRKIFNEGKTLAHQTLGGLSVADPIPGKHVFTLSVKMAVSWAISTEGKVAKRIRTEGKFFSTVASKKIESDEYTSPEHVDVAFIQSGNRFGF